MKIITFLGRSLSMTLLIIGLLSSNSLTAQDASPTPDCSSSSVQLRFLGFDENGVVIFEIVNTRMQAAPLNGFGIQWPSQDESSIRLQRVVIGGDNVNDYGQSGDGTLLWAGDDPNPQTTEDEASTTFWRDDYAIPPDVGLGLFVQFSGIEGTLEDELGWTPFDFNGTSITVDCPGSTGSGGGGNDGVVFMDEMGSGVEPMIPNSEASEEMTLDDAQPTATGSTADIEAAPSATPVQVAAARVLIRDDISGEVIGNGTVRVIAPESALSPESVRVELEVIVDNLYATPTPNTAPGTPVPRITSTPDGATERPPLFTESGLDLYQRMGATLTCSRESFLGCDEDRTLEQDKLINGTRTTWTWFLTPRDGINGPQDLRLDLWITQENLNESLEFIDIWDYAFVVTLNPGATANNNPLPLYIMAGLFVFAIAGGAVLWWQGRDAPEVISILDRKPQIPGQKNPRVFISYRHIESWALARSVANSLTERGANVFIDKDDINEGRFAEIIEKAIDRADYVVPIIGPGTLESEWVRREIKRAIEKDKNIIPLLADGFELDPDTLPEEINDLARHNAITMLPEFYEEAIERLARRFMKL